MPGKRGGSGPKPPASQSFRTDSSSNVRRPKPTGRVAEDGSYRVGKKVYDPDTGRTRKRKPFSVAPYKAPVRQPYTRGPDFPSPAERRAVSSVQVASGSVSPAALNLRGATRRAPMGRAPAAGRTTRKTSKSWVDRVLGGGLKGALFGASLSPWAGGAAFAGSLIDAPRKPPKIGREAAESALSVVGGAALYKPQFGNPTRPVLSGRQFLHGTQDVFKHLDTSRSKGGVYGSGTYVALRPGRRVIKDVVHGDEPLMEPGKTRAVEQYGRFQSTVKQPEYHGRWVQRRYKTHEKAEEAQKRLEAQGRDVSPYPYSEEARKRLEAQGRDVSPYPYSGPSYFLHEYTSDPKATGANVRMHTLRPGARMFDLTTPLDAGEAARAADIAERRANMYFKHLERQGKELPRNRDLPRKVRHQIQRIRDLEADREALKNSEDAVLPTGNQLVRHLADIEDELTRASPVFQRPGKPNFQNRNAPVGPRHVLGEMGYHGLVDPNAGMEAVIFRGERDFPLSFSKKAQEGAYRDQRMLNYMEHRSTGTYDWDQGELMSHGGPKAEMVFPPMDEFSVSRPEPHLGQELADMPASDVRALRPSQRIRDLGPDRIEFLTEGGKWIPVSGPRAHVIRMQARRVEEVEGTMQWDPNRGHSVIPPGIFDELKRQGDQPYLEQGLIASNDEATFPMLRNPPVVPPTREFSTQAELEAAMRELPDEFTPGYMEPTKVSGVPAPPIGNTLHSVFEADWKGRPLTSFEHPPTVEDMIGPGQMEVFQRGFPSHEDFVEGLANLQEQLDELWQMRRINARSHDQHQGRPRRHYGPMKIARYGTSGEFLAELVRRYGKIQGG